MAIFFSFLAAWLAALAQATFFYRLAFWGGGANLILAGVLAYAIGRQLNRQDWMIVGPLIVFDLLAGWPTGLFSISAVAMFLVTNWLSRRFLKTNNFRAIFSLTVGGLLIFETTYWFLGKILAQVNFWNLPITAPLDPGRHLVASLVLNGFLCWACLGLFKKIQLFKKNGTIF